MPIIKEIILSHSVTLSWTASTDQVDGYNVYRSTSPGAEAAPALNPSPISATTYTDPTASVGVKYDYVVTAVVNGFESIHSSEVESSVILPFPPSDLTISAIS